MSERGPISQGTGLAREDTDIVPGVVHYIITAKLPWMIGNQHAVAYHLDPLCTCPYGCRFICQFAVDAIVVPVIADQAGSRDAALSFRISLIR